MMAPLTKNLMRRIWGRCQKPDARPVDEPLQFVADSGAFSGGSLVQQPAKIRRDKPAWASR